MHLRQKGTKIEDRGAPGSCKERTPGVRIAGLCFGAQWGEALPLADGLIFVRMDATRRTDMVEDETTSYHRGHENGYWWLDIPVS